MREVTLSFLTKGQPPSKVLLGLKKEGFDIFRLEVKGETYLSPVA